ncbi:MAG: RNA pseudouridine synthase, partial [Oscillospiraceae bacterium]|nr:RNA pseudouridine synthase [Oscillospiraceae bacterium]
YEDENLLLLNKRPGLLAHPDETEPINTLITHIQAYLYQKKECDPYAENSFAPALCNRIDRNTGGIVIAAKNAEALRILNEKIRDREIDKRYLCVVVGRPRPSEGRLEDFIFKDARNNRVYASKKSQPGAKTAITDYRLIKSKGGLSLVECTLHTGRTHQIRAQMSAAGWPLLGDGKYGKEKDNKKFDETSGQALYSYKLRFDFPTDAGILEYLKGKTFEVREIDFVTRYFGE